MVKNVSLSPRKSISKNHNHHHHHQEKKQLNCLINVLRPKVYITDTSNFKKLVQELTGNTTTTTTTKTTRRTGTISSSSSSPPDHHQSHKIETVAVPIIDLVDQECQPDHDHLQLFLADQEIMGQLGNNCYINDQTRMYDAAFDQLSTVNSKEEGLLAYQDLESWLLQDSDGQETQDPCHFYNYDYNYSYNYGQFGDQQEQVSIYDYQLSGLI